MRFLRSSSFYLFLSLFLFPFTFQRTTNGGKGTKWQWSKNGGARECVVVHEKKKKKKKRQCVSTFNSNTGDWTESFLAGVDADDDARASYRRTYIILTGREKRWSDKPTLFTPLLHLNLIRTLYTEAKMEMPRYFETKEKSTFFCYFSRTLSSSNLWYWSTPM